MGLIIEPTFAGRTRADNIIWRGYPEAATDGLRKIFGALIPIAKFG